MPKKEKKELKQKPIAHYLQEEEVPEEYQEKVLLSITRLVYNRNQEVIEHQKTEDEVKKKEILNSILEEDKIIKKNIKRILEEKDGKEKCDECLDF